MTRTETKYRRDSESRVECSTDWDEEVRSTSLERTDIHPAEVARIRHWKESLYAVGKVDPTWKTGMRSCCDTDASSTDSPTCPTICSSWICGTLGAGRVGNMAILWQHNVKVQGRNEESLIQPHIDLIVGPYWFVACLITYPAIIGVSLLTAFVVIKNQHPALIAMWSLATASLLLALTCVSCRNPGIMIRQQDPPNHEHWHWNDQALTFRPTKAKYDKECGVVVEDLHHMW